MHDFINGKLNKFAKIQDGINVSETLINFQSMEQKKQFRVIPKIEIKGENVVKGIQMEGLRVLANPEELASFYYNNGADEIFFTDVVASLYGRNALLNVISSVSKHLFIPLTVGGGIRNIKDIYNVLRAGADKVCINSGAIKNKDFINEAVKEFGSSTIVVSIEATFLIMTILSF